MPGPENDPHVQARGDLARRVPGLAPSAKEQRRVIELMRQRARGSSLGTLYNRMQELERENERLRRKASGDPA